MALQVTPGKKILIAAIVIGAGIAIYSRRRIVRYAKKFIGVLEIGDNMGWNNPDFEKKLKSVGWYPGAQWCVFFVKAMWADTYPELRNKTHNGKKLIDYVSGNSQTTFSNLKNLENTGLFKVSGIPKAGDMVVWQYYDAAGSPTQKGHVGIVTSKSGDSFKTIEGNTSEIGATNQTVSKKEHNLGEYSKKTGLRLKGFIRYNYA